MKKTILIAMLLPIGLWAEEAKDVYADQCATCHGPDGKGATAKGKKLKVKDVHETAAKMKEDEMEKIVRDGKGADMAPFGKTLTPAMVKAVVAYYRGLAK